MIIVGLMVIGFYFNFLLRIDGDYGLLNFFISLLFIGVFLAFSYYSGLNRGRVSKRLLWIYTGLGVFMTVSYYLLNKEIVNSLLAPFILLMGTIFSPLMGLSYLDKGINLFLMSSILIGLIGIGLYYLGERRALK